MGDHLFKIARENSFHNFYNIHVNEFQLSALNFPYCKNNAEMFHCQEDRLKQNLPRPLITLPHYKMQHRILYLFQKYQSEIRFAVIKTSILSV